MRWTSSAAQTRIMNKTFLSTLTLLLLLAHSVAPGVSQLCDENPAANNGVKVASQASTACLKGHTPGMVEISTCQDNSAHDIRLPFAFKFLGRTYNGTGNGGVFVGSNSYVTFGGSSSAGSGLGPLTPAFPTFFIGARDNAMRNLSVGPDALGWRVRYEGWSLPSLANDTHKCSLAFPPTIIWELLFRYDDTLQLCTGVVMENIAGVSALSDGVSSFFIQKFTLTPSTSYAISTGLRPCTCDYNLQVNKGVKIRTQTSYSCMKGRTPDMIDVRSCQRGGSTSILLPFPFKFLGRTYGGQNNDVFVGDSSFVTFGGADNTYYSSFEPGFSELPALLIGARQNVLKTLSVAPDPLGWRVRYEGWSDHGASFEPYPAVSSAFTCSQSHIPANNRLPNFASNITWELLFLYDGTLQLCTDSLMGNLDPVFDSVAINTRHCSGRDVAFCTNFFQNLSAVSALSDGGSSPFLQTFVLTPSTLFTISTGLFQCSTSCDDDPVINKGFKVQYHGSSPCLKGRTSDMTDVGRCQDSAAYSVRLPFPIRFLARSYSGEDVFVGSDSYVSFGGASTARPPPFPSLLIGVRDNAMKKLSVGPDPWGWRVRFEGWDSYLSQNQTIQCNRPANIVWELLFFYNSTIQLCTSSSMDNIDLAIDPPVLTSVWDGTSVVTNLSLAPSSLYSFSSGLPPCSLHLSLSCPIASIYGSSMTALFPPQLGTLPYDSVTLVITLHGVGFSCAPSTPILLVVSPANSASRGFASISNSGDAMPLLTVSLTGVENCSLVSFTLPSVTNPLLPQTTKNVRFSMFGPNQNVIFSGNSGSLVEILPPMPIDAGQPTLRLINNAIKATTTMNITLTPTIMRIPAEFAPSVLVITLVGAGWSIPGTVQGQFIRPLQGKIVSASITADASRSPVLRVSFSGVESISPISPLQLLVFDLTTVGVAQSASVSIRSAILNSFGSIMASGSKGSINGVIASTMGVGSPTVTVLSPLASALAVDIEVSLTPSPQDQLTISLPARIIITLSGSGFACGSGAAVKFTLPFDAANGTVNVLSVAGKNILMISVPIGTFLSGYPVLFRFGPCSAPTRAQPQKTDILAAMIDKDGRTVAASASGTLNGIVEDMGQLNLLLENNSLRVTIMPQVFVPANSILVISLTGIGLVCKEDEAVQFLQPQSGASGTATIAGRPLESILSISFASQHSARTQIVFTVSPVYGGCSADASNLTAALLDRGGNILAATQSSLFSAMTTRPAVTVQQTIVQALNGVIIIPDGIFAGTCNCNNVIDANTPTRAPGAVVEMKGSAGKSIIDCSATGMRCLIVQHSSVNVVNITFKGGSSPVFVSSSMIKAIRALFDAENPTAAEQANQTVKTAANGINRSLLKKTLHKSRSDEGILRRRIHRSRLESDAKNDPNAKAAPRQRHMFFNVVTKIGRMKQMTRAHQKINKSRLPSRSQLRLRGNRQLLQSAPASTMFSMFTADSDGAGGCIYILAPSHSVSLSGVSMFNCSAVYGGGGFFNVSLFAANQGTAQGNVARQGGGIFLAASQRAEIEHVKFLNNTAVTSVGPASNDSPAFEPGFREFGALSLIPNPAAAAGGGLWVQRLSAMRNCTFGHNLALASSGSVSTRAVGGSMFVLQTSRGSEISDVHLSHSRALCSGGSCTAAGTIFLAFVDFNTSMHRIAFFECHVAAVGTLATTILADTWGSAIVVQDASAGMLRINHLQSSHCSAKSSGYLTGGVMYFPRLVRNAVFSNISIYNFNIKSDVLSFHSGGLLTFFDLESTIISDVTVNSAQFIHPKMRSRIFGIVFYSASLRNTSLISWNISAIFLKVINCENSNCQVYGGLALIGSMDNMSILTNISFQHSHLEIDGAQQISAAFLGAVLYINSNWGIDFEIFGAYARGLAFRNVSVYVTGERTDNRFVWFYHGQTTAPNGIMLQNWVFENILMFCNGTGCRNSGLTVLFLATQASINRAQKNESPARISDFVFHNITSACSGVRCAVRGGGFQLYSIYSAVLRNVQLNNVSLRSNGAASFAGGTFLFHLYNDPTGSLLIQNISSEGSTVHVSGVASSAIGGVIVALYGDFTISNSMFRKAFVSCSGEKCQAAGGFFAFTSAYGFTPLRLKSFSVSVSNVDESDAVVQCSGVSCSAIGGASFIGVAYRGPTFESAVAANVIAPKSVVEVPLKVQFKNCRIFLCTVKSDSVGAVLTGAGLSVLLASVEIVNSSIMRNTIQSTPLSGVTAGSGIYVTGSNSSVSVASTVLKHNSAGSNGLGGAIFAGPESSLSCVDVVVEFNSAHRGGGLMSDLASVSLSRSILCNNSAVDKGGGIFCVSSLSLKGASALVLNNVTVIDNFLQTSGSSAVGAAVFLFGDVQLEIQNHSRIVMTGNSKFTTSEAVLSLMRPVKISNNTVLSCKGGSVLGATPTEVINQIITLNTPGVEEEIGTQCSPACLFRPEANPYVASGGLLASCIPCPLGTYSIATSSNSNETVASQCIPCPFGALCHGGSNISAAKSHWGWKISDHQLTQRFILLPSGYGCKENCAAVAPCGGNRADILCGACATNYSVAFFQSECVLSVQCAAWKWAPLIFLCFAYQFFFSLWMFWSSEVSLFERQERSRFAAKEALKQVPLFQNLSPDEIDAVVSNMELVHFAAQSTILSQGSPGFFMYIVETGVVNVFVLNSNTGIESLVATLGASNVIGELSLIKDTNCGASVRAAVDSEMWRLDRSCLNNVAEEDKDSFVKAKQAQYAKTFQKSGSAVGSGAYQELSSAFGILMWFYQLSGIMLSVSSPLDYLDGSAIAFSIVSFFVNSKPSSEAASDVSTKVAPSPSVQAAGIGQSSVEAADTGPFKFCVSASFTMSQLYITTFMYYVLWALLMAVMSQNRVWKFLRSAVIKFAFGFAVFLDYISGFVKTLFKKDAYVFAMTLREQFSLRHNIDIEIRGPVLLKWVITCFSALSSLAMQGTACYRLNGFLDAADDLRWIYDGRVACFADSGDFPGRWQIAAAFGVALFVLAPAVLWKVMSAIKRTEKRVRTPFQQTIWDAYSGLHSSNACHWMVVM